MANTTWKKTCKYTIQIINFKIKKTNTVSRLDRAYNTSTLCERKPHDDLTTGKGKDDLANEIKIKEIVVWN